MIWLLPLAALGSLDRKMWAMLALVFATMLTPIIFPSLTANYANGLNLAETSVLVLRNLILVAAWLWLVRELFPRPATVPATASCDAS